MKLILIRSPQLLFYKMKSKKGDKNMMMDTITISYNYNPCVVREILNNRTISFAQELICQATNYR